MSTFVSDIIQEAFLDLAVVQPGETISATMQAAAFLVLQQMYASWGAEQLMAYSIHHDSFTLTAGTTNYTLGPSGSLATFARPARVTGWSSSSGNFKNGGPISSFEQLHAVAKGQTGKRSVLAEMVAADGAFPFINIEVFPTPDASPGALRLDFYAYLESLGTVSPLILPDGWEAALHFNLAIALYPQYARVGSGAIEALAANAQNSKGIIVRRNAEILGMQQQPQQQAQ